MFHKTCDDKIKKEHTCCENYQQIKNNSDQALNKQRSEWKLKKELWENNYIYAITWFFCGLGLYVIVTFITLSPFIIIKNSNYSNFNNILFKTSMIVSTAQGIISPLIAIIYNMKKCLIATNIITKVQLNKDSLIITIEKYREIFRRHKALRIKYISKPSQITLKEYKILLETNKFIKISYKEGNKLKKLKIFTEYFDYSESLISILKKNATNISTIKNKKYIPLPLKIFSALIIIDIFLAIIFASILFFIC